MEHTQRQESGGGDRGTTKGVHHQGPKTIRGGIGGENEKNVTSPPKSMRGGGGSKHATVNGGNAGASTTTSDKEEDGASFGKQASGFVSRLFHK